MAFSRCNFVVAFVIHLLPLAFEEELYRYVYIEIHTMEMINYYIQCTLH